MLVYFWILIKGEEFKIVNRISEITKLDILDLFHKGIDIDEVFKAKK